jgi:holo-[acyl-carrier protein] synthase
VIRGIGVDICSVERLYEALERNPGLESKLFTPAELTRSNGTPKPIQSLAGRFAAKEAFVKALNAAYGGEEISLNWSEVEIEDTRSAPRLLVRGNTEALCKRLGITRLHLSISHDASYAVANVVAEG